MSAVPREAAAAEPAAVFEDPRSQALLARIRQLAASDASVLIDGETGSGKEFVARHLHASSARHGGPFVVVHCGAFAGVLMDSELFGHERGAFTGAFTARAGGFEAADGGTLLLDEVGDLPEAAQARLLQVLTRREVVRLGGTERHPVDVRVLAATDGRLHAALAEGRFRGDLFHRLHVARLALPALRERPGDILPLARHFIGTYRQRLGYGALALSLEAEARLLRHDWPGNIRELENVVQHALLIAHGTQLQADDLQLAARRAAPVHAPDQAESTPDAWSALAPVLRRLFESPGPRLFDDIEDAVMREAFVFCQRNQVQAARLLGISRNVLRSRLIRSREIDALK